MVPVPSGEYEKDTRLFTYTVENKQNFTPNMVAAELPQVLVNFFNCFKSDVLFDCIDQENIYRTDRNVTIYHWRNVGLE